MQATRPRTKCEAKCNSTQAAPIYELYAVLAWLLVGYLYERRWCSAWNPTFSEMKKRLGWDLSAESVRLLIEEKKKTGCCFCCIGIWIARASSAYVSPFLLFFFQEALHTLSLSPCVCVCTWVKPSLSLPFGVESRPFIRISFVTIRRRDALPSSFFFMCLCVFYLNDIWKKQLGFLKSNLGVKEISLTFNLLTFLWNFKWRQFWKILNWSKKRVMYHSDYWTMCYSDVWRGAAKVSSNRRVQLLANNRQIIDCIANWSSQ